MFLAEVLGLRASKHSNVRRIHQRCVIDPFLRVGDLFVQLFALRQGKVISDRSASQLHTAQIGVSFDLEQEFFIHIRWKKVAGDFSTRNVIVGAPVDEIENTPKLHVAFGLLFLIPHPLKALAETVSGDSELHPAFARTVDRLNARKSSGTECREACGEKMTT